jgi:hypothetical protein
MFGAHGLYSGDKFFGILDEGRLFFKTDAAGAAGDPVGGGESKKICEEKIEINGDLWNTSRHVCE